MKDIRERHGLLRGSGGNVILEAKPQPTDNGGGISFTQQILNMKDFSGLIPNEVSGPSNTQPMPSVPGKHY